MYRTRRATLPREAAAPPPPLTAPASHRVPVQCAPVTGRAPRTGPSGARRTPTTGGAGPDGRPLRSDPPSAGRACAVRRDAHSDPDVLERMLEAAHAAPSVGLSQPWDFVLVYGRQTAPRVLRARARRAARLRRSTLAGQEAERFAGIKIDGVLEAALSVVVTYDPARGAPARAGSPRHRRRRPLLRVPGHREPVARLPPPRGWGWAGSPSTASGSCASCSASPNGSARRVALHRAGSHLEADSRSRAPRLAGAAASRRGHPR